MIPACYWPTVPEVDRELERGRVLLEEYARVDLARADAPRPDEHYAARWQWSLDDVRTLRGGRGWRERAALPQVARVRA